MFVFCLPVSGSPYLVGIYRQDKLLAVLQTIVGGNIDTPGNTTINKAFLADKRWEKANQMLQLKSTEVYANDEGMYNCGVNMGVFFYGQPAFGNIAMVTKKCENVDFFKKGADETDEDMDEDETEDEDVTDAK